MKLGSCLLLLAKDKDSLGDEFIPMIKEAGYDYIEAPLARMLKKDKTEIKSFIDILDKNDIRVEAFNNANPYKFQHVGPSVDEAAVKDYIDRTAELVKRMGVKVISAPGPIKTWVPKTYGWDRIFVQYVEFLKRFADKLAPIGAKIGIEPINDEEYGFVATVGEAVRCIDTCKAENIGIAVDYYHFFKQNDDMDEFLSLAGKYVCHVHYATFPERVYPLDKDEDEMKRRLGALKEAGYSGRVSMEARTENAEKDLAESAKLFKKTFE